MRKLKTLVICLALVSASVGSAQTIPEVWGVWDWPYTEPIHIMITPGDGGDPLNDADFFGGAPVDATIRVQLWASGGSLEDPQPPQSIANFPSEDLWLEAPGVAMCMGGATADANTDADGWFTFSGRLNGGGWTDANLGAPGLQVIVSGMPLDDQTASIRPHILVNSPDLDGDGRVSITDIPPFADDFYGAYAFRSDFLWDGVINLSDVTRFAASLGESCP
ncbi:MAG: hypothetical protein QNL91_02740 [Candidatus Krumholzibacteria bacterium]|nr:hypothetical protein [Candidatus Krumholzibacteria bacterium]